jgi:hypothetical protein
MAGLDLDRHRHAVRDRDFGAVCGNGRAIQEVTAPWSPHKHVRAEGLTTGFELIKACGIPSKTSRLRLRRVRGIAWHL